MVHIPLPPTLWILPLWVNCGCEGVKSQCHTHYPGQVRVRSGSGPDQVQVRSRSHQLSTRFAIGPGLTNSAQGLP